MLDEIPLQNGAFYVLDRAYLDFKALTRWPRQGAFFVVRSKRHLRFAVLRSRPVDKTLGLRCDQTIRLVTDWSRRRFSGLLRRIRVYDANNRCSVVLLTNHFELPARVVAELYRRRWQVELFFKWIKQHLRLRAFLGRSENAVRLQVWSAICAYLLVAIIKRKLQLPYTLHQVLQVISVSVFEPVPLPHLFHSRLPPPDDPNQLLLLP
jgi:IS4 transposase